jgi:hypothetical protein
MAVTQDVFVLADFGASTFEERRRTTSRGTKSRYSVSILAKPVLVDFSAIRLGRAPALAIRDTLRTSIRNIGTFASQETRDRRQRASRELAAGLPGAMRRYAGGRTGVTPPNQTGRLFNDSGRLAENLEVRQTGSNGEWIVNVTANRFDPTTFTPAQFQAMIARLMQLAPAWRGGQDLLRDPAVVKAISEGLVESVHGLGGKEGSAGSARKQWLSSLGSLYGLLRFAASQVDRNDDRDQR